MRIIFINDPMRQVIHHDLERIATRNPQRVKIEPLRFSLAYNGDAFCHCPLHFIRRIS